MIVSFGIEYLNVKLWLSILLFSLMQLLNSQNLISPAERNLEFGKKVSAHQMHWLIPNNLSIQLLRNPGFLSIGVGYNVLNVYEPSLFFGYMFQNFGKGQLSPTLSMKHNFRLLGGPLQRDYNLRAGLSVNFALSENTYEKMPVYDKRRSYFSNELYLTPFLGGDVRVLNSNALFSGGNLFFELVTLDVYMKNLMNNRFVKFEDIWSFNLGITVYLQ